MAQQKSQCVHVPVQQAVAVDYPGYVQNVEAALGTMGGLQGIAEACSGGTMQVSCRPNDQLAHPLYAGRQQRQALLLRLTKPLAGGNAAAASAVKAEVVARVPVGYRFSGMADFQYIGGKSQSEALEQVPEVDGPFGPEREPLNVPPPLFSKQDEPQDYAFRWPLQAPQPVPKKKAPQAAAQAQAAQQQSAAPPPQQQPSQARQSAQQPRPAAQQAAAAPSPPAQVATPSAPEPTEQAAAGGIRGQRS